MRAAISTASIVAGCLMLASCGSEKEGTFETSEGERGSYSIDEDGGTATATIKTDDGTAVMRSGQDVPIDLPDGFTIYPGAKVVSNTTFSQADSSGSLIVLESEAEPDEIAAHYRKQAEAAGIDIQLEMSVNGGKMIGGEGPGGQVFSLNANSDGGKTSAQLMLGGKKGG